MRGLGSAAAQRANRIFFVNDESSGDAVAFLGMDLVEKCSANPTEEQIAEFRVHWLELAFQGRLPDLR